MRCERCLAKDGDPHPAGGFVVDLEQITIDGKEKHLCQKCKARELIHSNEYSSSESFSIKKFISNLFS